MQWRVEERRHPCGDILSKRRKAAVVVVLSLQAEIPCWSYSQRLRVDWALVKIYCEMITEAPAPLQHAIIVLLLHLPQMGTRMMMAYEDGKRPQGLRTFFFLPHAFSLIFLSYYHSRQLHHWHRLF
jgi:hypothetical protein